MHDLLGRHRVNDIDSWKEVIEADRAGLRAAGALDEEKRKRGEIPRLTFLVAR
jgi:hypothetical protein